MSTTVKTRGRFAISLRVLMILVLVLGGGIGWAVNRLNSRRGAVDAVRKLKGTVFFDYQVANGQYNRAAKPWAPGWLLRVLPEEFFHDVALVTKLDLARTTESDAKAAMAAIGTFGKLEQLRISNPPPGTTISGLDRLKTLVVTLARPGGEPPIHLGRLASLKEVYFDGPGVNDDVLSELARLPSLQEIRLQNTSVTDAGLARLESLGQLGVLWLGDAKVTDAGLPSLVKLRKLVILNLIGNRGVTDQGIRFVSLNVRGLKHLMVSRTGVTDVGLAHLDGFAGLEGLQMEGQGAKFTDAGLARLAGLSHLEVLNAGGSGVTDAGLESLGELKMLRWLNLSETAVGDAGIKRLGKIQSLRWLNLSGTHVTDAGLKDLSGLNGLEQVFIDESQITDGGLRNLYGLKSLKVVVVGGDGISALGVAELRAALPPATVVRMGTAGAGASAAASSGR